MVRKLHFLYLEVVRYEDLRVQYVVYSEPERQLVVCDTQSRRCACEGIAKVAEALNGKGGIESVNMQLAQQYLAQFGNLAKTNNTMIIPSNLADVAGVLKACTSVIKKVEG